MTRRARRSASAPARAEPGGRDKPPVRKLAKDLGISLVGLAGTGRQPGPSRVGGT